MQQWQVSIPIGQSSCRFRFLPLLLLALALVEASAWLVADDSPFHSYYIHPNPYLHPCPLHHDSGALPEMFFCEAVFWFRSVLLRILLPPLYRVLAVVSESSPVRPVTLPASVVAAALWKGHWLADGCRKTDFFSFVFRSIAIVPFLFFHIFVEMYGLLCLSYKFWQENHCFYYIRFQIGCQLFSFNIFRNEQGFNNYE